MSWIKTRSSRESLIILEGLARQCADLGGPVARSIFELVKAHDWPAVVLYDLEPLYETIDVRDAIMSRQILGLFQKSEWLDIGVDKVAAATKRFHESEELCLATNRRFSRITSHPFEVSATMHSILYLMQRKIGNILGELPCLADLNVSFGPGGSTNVKSSHANPRFKLSANLECSSNMSPTVGTFLAEVPFWAAHHSHAILWTGVQTDDFDCQGFVCDVSVVPGKVMFVPKNAKTHRSIVVEPSLNTFFQKGYGTFIRSRLLHSGVDLKDGQVANQKAAMWGSAAGTLATVDLSMASDCVASGLVSHLLPPDWFDALASLRTQHVTVNNSEMRLEKFSSMGNGYTFELESLIFFAACHSVCKHLGVSTKEILVYGDDIIIPVEAYDLLEECLNFCGFKFNREKSFKTGPFRESCGADFLSGFDIRPFYQKTLVSDRTLYTMHNWFVRHGEFELAAATLKFTNASLRLYGPDGFGDGHLIGTHSLRRNREISRSGWCGGYFDTYALKARRCYDALPGDAILPLYSVYTRSGELDPTDPDVIRGSRGYAKVSIYTLSECIFPRFL